MTASPAEILRRLVAFDTVSANSNLALIEWVADYLRGYGIATSLTFNEARDKANLFATIGPADAGGHDPAHQWMDGEQQRAPQSQRRASGRDPAHE